jgi:hypothetical protein
MQTLVSIAVVVAVAYATEWLVDTSLGEARRFWVWIAGVGMLLLSGALVKASGVEALTRYLRSVLIGAGIGAVLDRIGLRLTWLRRGLRLIGIETEAAKPGSPAAWQGPRIFSGLLWAGWGASLVGIGMIWTGAFAG